MLESRRGRGVAIQEKHVIYIRWGSSIHVCSGTVAQTFFSSGLSDAQEGRRRSKATPLPHPYYPPHPSWIFTALWLLSWSPLIRKNGSPSALFFCPFTTGTFPLLDYEFTAGCVSGNHHVGRCLAMPTLHEAYL